jgi:hypothetical protein
MECFHGPRPSANQAKIIWMLLEQYRFRHKVGSFTTDNATNTYTAMCEQAKLFSNVNLAFDVVSARMWCFGHIINLVVKAFLWSQNADAVGQELGALNA